MRGLKRVGASLLVEDEDGATWGGGRRGFAHDVHAPVDGRVVPLEVGLLLEALAADVADVGRVLAALDLLVALEAALVAVGLAAVTAVPGLELVGARVEDRGPVDVEACQTDEAERAEH
jgi:hypothetical protein